MSFLFILEIKFNKLKSDKLFHKQLEIKKMVQYYMHNFILSFKLFLSFIKLNWKILVKFLIQML